MLYEFQDGGRQTRNIYRDSYTKFSQHISASMRLRNKIPTDPDVVGHQEFNGAIKDVVPLNRMSEIQDGGR